MRKKRRKRTESGVSRRVWFLFALPALIAGSLFALSMFADDAKPKAVIAGTVFRDPGFAFPRAEATLSPLALPSGVKKFKPLRLFTDARGEFAFYVPAGEARYRISASAAGFSPDEKTVAIAAGGRVDVYLTLKPNAP